MSTLAPKISDQISFERPVGAAPSVLESVLGVATQLGSDYANAQAKANASSAGGGGSASDQKGAALSGYVAELDRIDSLDLDTTEKERLIQRARRDQLIATPQYRTDILGISEDEFNFDTGQGQIENAFADQFTEWLQTPKGIVAVSEQKMDANGQGGLDANANRKRLEARFMEDMSQKARIQSLAELDANDQLKWRELSPQWTENSAAMATGMAVNASTNPELLAKPEEALKVLNDSITAASQSFRAEAQAAGIGSEYIEAQLPSILKPLTDLKGMYESDMENPGKVLDAVNKAAELGVTRELIETMGPIMADSTAREIFLTHYMSDKVNGDNAEAFFKGMSEAVTSGDMNSFNLGVDVLPGVREAVTTEEPVVSTDKVTEWRRKARENPEFIPQRLGVAASTLGQVDINSEGGQDAALTSLKNIALASQAHEGPLGEETLGLIFTPKAISNIKALGDEGEVLMSRILVQQVKYNRSLIAGSSELMSDTRISLRNGVFVAERRWRDPLGVADAMGVRSDWRPITGNSQLAKSTAAVNRLMGVSRQIPGLSKTVEDATNFLYRGIEPTPEQVSSLPDDFSWDDLENVQHTSSQSPNQLVALIDRTEGGGSYDTLFGHSQRNGGKFAGIRISEMTLNELARFSDVNGGYGQWVKSELGRSGQKPRVATPMGRYQFVGTTMRATAEAMGLSPDTLFDERTQDAMFAFKAQERLRGKTGESARNALRAEWEGFKHVSNEELDVAIAQFKGMPPPDVSNLRTASGKGAIIGSGGGAGGFLSTSGGGATQEEPNGFLSLLVDAAENGGLRGVDTSRDRNFNPNVPVPSRGGIDTGAQQRGSRMTTSEARAQIIAALRGAGMEDSINEIIKGEG